MPTSQSWPGSAGPRCPRMVRRAVLLGTGYAHLFTLKRAAAFVRRGFVLVLVAPERGEELEREGPRAGWAAGVLRPDEDRFEQEEQPPERFSSFFFALPGSKARLRSRSDRMPTRRPPCIARRRWSPRCRRSGMAA